MLIVKDSLSLEGAWFHLFDDSERFPARIKIRPLFADVTQLLMARHEQTKIFSRVVNDETIFSATKLEMLEYLLEGYESLSENENFEDSLDGEELKHWVFKKARELAEQRILEALGID